MKAVILAGGMGTRLSEETAKRPKPMVEVGGKPILWHIMKIYSAHGVHDFVVCCGYRGYLIKEYFANYFLHTADVTFDLPKNEMTVHQNTAEPWRVTLVDTGDETGTGGRLRRVREYVQDSGTFCFTYGDGVADVDIRAVIELHRGHGLLATMTAIQPPSRYGVLAFDERTHQRLVAFQEKPTDEGGWINGGFFVLEPGAIDYIDDDATHWERAPLQRLVADGQIAAYQHRGYWQCMDTLRDKNMLEAHWASGEAPWKIWD